MPRYRLAENAFLNNPFTLVSSEYEEQGSGIVRTKPEDREMFSAMIEKGCVVELGSDIIPGPYMEPMDDEAKALFDKYSGQTKPNFHADVSALPLAGEPLPDAPSYGNETNRNTGAPVFDKRTQGGLGVKPSFAPKLPPLSAGRK